MGKPRDWAAEEKRRQIQREIEKSKNPPEPKPASEFQKTQSERALIRELYISPVDLFGFPITKLPR